MCYKLIVVLNILDISYDSIREGKIEGRYVNHLQLEPILSGAFNKWSIQRIGASVEERDIYTLTYGRGPLRVLIWSQMHGNESTSTKAILDLVNSLEIDTELSELIGSQCTLKIIPILNPDGAWHYNRVNANGIDLNRDAQDQSQPESLLLSDLYMGFKPDFCFNLHGQRTIYSAGKNKQPATLSFLSPAASDDGALTPARLKSMKLISAMYEALLPYLSGRMGRYSDSYNLDCVGDTIQTDGCPTLLFEAGHFPGDYEREIVRKYMWFAILTALKTLAEGNLERYSIEKYMEIPSNEELFFDILIRNAAILGSQYGPGESIGILFKEVLNNRQIEFRPEIAEKGELSDHYGHVEYDCKKAEDLQAIKSDGNLNSLFLVKS